mmetsp:Transcript_32781/g.103957  ORF Transcript_32781/g.103957 Transcript_32781/m.103957 type:complete len:390 (+) Transcript_32781:892-2061(+)
MASAAPSEGGFREPLEGSARNWPSLATSRSASMTYSLRDIWRWVPPRSGPLFFLPMDSRITPGCTFIVSTIGGWPCCSFEKLSVNSLSAGSFLPPLFSRCRRVVRRLLRCAAWPAELGGACCCCVAGPGGLRNVLSDSARSCRGSFLMLVMHTSVTLGSLSGLTSSTQMTLPSESNLCSRRAISSCIACTFLRSSSWVLSASRAFRSFSRFLASSWLFWSRSLSSSSSTVVSSCQGAALGSTFSGFGGALADLLRVSEGRDRGFCCCCCCCSLLTSAALLALLEVEEVATQSSPRASLRTGRCMRAQLSMSPGLGSSSSVQSSSGPSSPSSCATKAMAICDTTACVTASAAKWNAFLSRYFCHRSVPPSTRMASITVATASSAPPSVRL